MIAVLVCSCASEYQIVGRTSLSTLDGKMLYVKAIQGEEMVKVDSCEVIHGNFSMRGVCDTARMAQLFMDDQSVMPIVLEPAPLTINIDDTIMRVSGTVLNDRLYEFLHKKAELDMQAAELPRRESRMYMDGKDEFEIDQMKASEIARLNQAYDRLVMEYVTGNFDNILGVGIFIMLTNGAPPMMNAQIEDIMSKATPYFKNDPYVKSYLKAAEENMRHLR